MRLSGRLLLQRKTRGQAPFSRSDSRLGKKRLNLQAVLQKDREEMDRFTRGSWRERLGVLADYPWKTFILFMAAWSYLGMYVIPYMKKDLPEFKEAKMSNRFLVEKKE